MLKGDLSVTSLNSVILNALLMDDGKDWKTEQKSAKLSPWQGRRVRFRRLTRAKEGSSFLTVEQVAYPLVNCASNGPGPAKQQFFPLPDGFGVQPDNRPR